MPVYLFDPFSGGGNVALAHDGNFYASDIDPCWSFQRKRDYRDIHFVEGSVVWASPPCVNHSRAGLRSRVVSVHLSENKSLPNAETVFVENVTGYPVEDELRFLAELGFFVFVGEVDFSLFGSCQRRVRKLAIATKSPKVYYEFWRKLNSPLKPRSAFSVLRNVPLCPDDRGSELSPGHFRLLHGSNVRPHPLWGFLPTLTKTALSRRFAIAVNLGYASGVVRTEDLAHIDGFPNVCDRFTAARVLGDGVPFNSVQHFLSVIYETRT